MNKLYYIEGKFWGLIGVPEKLCKDGCESSSYCFDSCVKEITALESCKENKKEIVNIEILLDVCLYYDANERPMVSENRSTYPKQLQPGDIFDLPNGYEFKKERLCDWKGCKSSGKCFDLSTCYERDVLRLVKTEGKELLSYMWNQQRGILLQFIQPEPEKSQTELWKEIEEIFRKKYFEQAIEHCNDNYTISRKRP